MILQLKIGNVYSYIISFFYSTSYEKKNGFAILLEVFKNLARFKNNFKLLK